MNSQTTVESMVREKILSALRERALVEKSRAADFDPEPLLPEDDVFAKFGLSSMGAFAVIVNLERTLDVVIGEDPSDFERTSTLGGLQGLLSEKVSSQGSGASSEGASA